MGRKFQRYMLDVHIGTNRKIRGLTVPQRWCFVAGVLPVAAQAPIRGTLMIGHRPAAHKDYAEIAGVSPRVALAMLCACRALALIEPDDDLRCERVHDFEDYNPMPKRDDTAAERSRRYREKLRRHAVITDRDAVTVTERDSHAVTPGKRREEKEDRAKAPSSPSDADRADPKISEDDKRLCRLLTEQMQHRNPKAKVRSPSKWLNDMRLLRERDGNSASEIEQAIRWAFRDQFWGGVIQSPGNLREHFPQIWDRMKARPSTAGVEGSEQFLARRKAAA